MLQLQSLALSPGLTPASIQLPERFTAGRRRVFSRRRPPISKPREDATRWRRPRRRPQRRAGGARGWRSPFDALSLGEGRRAEKPAAASRPAEDVDARLAASGRAVAPGLSHVGRRQDRPAPARRRFRGLRRHRRAHARRTRGARRCSGRADLAPTPPCAPLDGQASLRPPLAARSRRDRARRLLQLDTVFVNLTPTKAIKHFAAYDPIAKWTVGKAFNRASAQAAAAFLDKIVADMPFPVKAIQVDGGLPSGVNQLNPILDSYRTSTTIIDPTEPLPKNPSPVSRSPISQDTHTVPHVLSPDTALTRIAKRPTLATAH
jgi:hypothetical protein